MGWDINVSRIDFGRLLQVRGSKNERLLAQLVSAHALDEEDGLAADDEDDEDADPAYSDAVAILYEALSAQYIGDLRVASWGIASLFQEVDDVLAARGFPGYLSQLVLGGCPFEVPIDVDGALGFMSPADCERFGAEYARCDWSAVPPALLETVVELHRWCVEAAEYGQGLVAAGG